ncbi:hypothetical protein [Sinorhizobium americanum]|uniref:Glucosamine inositolphosphorylceramide transferase 1 N-terminal domain-containing protein n=1 Tax=Sinorhizobium americanum TaxID=194963 RepID=A0A1L3LX48_9HYPH|nr:hypothetical protein [Sinorhizobium americanum]APG94680.1 hypothetical protein SAMCFNEI73_pC0968 [Sinorhizobium americanum]OAP48715.1 hypothetical protein ATC00_23910 [Sinorhizobium americanum]
MRDLSHPLRIGILADAVDFENWQLMVFDRIIADRRYALTAILIDRPRGLRTAPSTLLKLAYGFEEKTLGRQAPYSPCNFEARKQRIVPLAQATPGAIQAQIAELGLDLVIRMSPNGMPDDAVGHLRYGEWAFSFSDQKARGCEWFSYREIARNAACVDLSLYVRFGAGVGEIAASSFNIKFSALRNINFVKERAATLLMRELSRLADSTELRSTPRPSPDTAPPTTGELVKYVGGLTGRLAGRAFKAVQKKTGSGSAVWTLYTGSGRIDSFEPRGSVEIPSTRDDIRADPFLLEHEGACYLFYEAYANGDRKAHIAVGRLDGDRLEPIGIALDCHYHLSYPFVFRDGGEIFMMPETHQSKRIEIWRCVEFPLKWELHSTALNGLSAADSVLTRHADRWWLFTNLSEYHAYEDHCSELHIFEVDGPALSRITPHRRNPVVIGSTFARNAGRIFARDDRVFRPSQRNAHGIYGYGLNIMEIEQLDLDTYSEKCVRTIEPDFKPGLVGCHHFDAAGDRYVLDARLTS